MTTTLAQSTTGEPGAAPESKLASVTAALARLVASPEPAVVLTSLAALCVPAFSQECCIAVAEDDQRGYWICYPGREPSPESTAMLQRWLTGADPVDSQIGKNNLSTTITAPPEFGDTGYPGYRGVIMHRWLRYQPAAADAALARVMMHRVLDCVRQERLIQQLQQHRLQVENLQIAVLSNREIGAAVGILMAIRQVPAAAAFELLRSASQRRNLKLRDIAAEVVFTGALDEGRTTSVNPFGHGWDRRRSSGDQNADDQTASRTPTASAPHTGNDKATTR